MTKLPKATLPLLITFLLASLPIIATAAQPLDTHTERIARIENGLLPPFNSADATPMRLSDRLKHYKVPGISIAVVEAGKVAWARGYGVRDAGAGAGASDVGGVTPDTLFQAASVSKPVTAMAALRMVELKQLKLDENVNEKLTSWQISGTPNYTLTAANPVTLRRILTHRAGLTVSGFNGYPADAKIPTLVQILNGEPPANSGRVQVDIAPQQEARYSGGGFTVLQQLMMDASGKNFPQLLNELVLAPAGMTRSTFAQPLSAQAAIQAASGHDDNGKPLAGKARIHPELAAAGLWTTPTELAQFAINLQNSSSGNSAILSPAMAQQMLTAPLDNWGLGIQLDGKPKAQRFVHFGSNEGFKSLMIAYRDLRTSNGSGVIIMANGEGAWQLMQEVLRAVATEYQWKRYTPLKRPNIGLLPTASFAPVEGFYLNRNTTRPTKIDVQIKRGGDILYAQVGDAPWSALRAKDESTFYVDNYDAEFVFIKTHANRPAALIVKEEDETDITLTRSTASPIAIGAQTPYLRGSMNNWDTSTPLQRDKNDSYSATVKLPAGNHEFKIASNDFKALDLGVLPSQSDLALGKSSTLVRLGGNIKINVATAGMAKFSLSATDNNEPTIMVELVP